MLIVNSEGLPDFEYHKVGYPKNQIVLHHTVSAIGKYVDDWFKADKGKSKVAVAYVVDKDGTIFQLFEPKYWGWHIGRGSTIEHNKNSIGIEVVNEGPLHKGLDRNLRWWIDKNSPSGKYLYKHTPVDLGYSYRGYRYFASYTMEQYEAVNQLLAMLMSRFGIRRNFTNHFDYNSSILDYKGIVMHVNIRADKTDLSPAYDITKISDWVNVIRKSDIIPLKPVEKLNLPEFDIKKMEMTKVTYDVR